MKSKNKEKEYLFIDGYNIINAWDQITEISKYFFTHSESTWNFL